MMDCEMYKSSIDLLVTETLDQARRLDLEKHLERCLDCRSELEATRRIWALLGELPVPASSGAMRGNFHSMLTNFKKDSRENIRELPVNRSGVFNLSGITNWVKYAAAIVLLLTGIGLGYLLNHPATAVLVSNRKMDSLATEVNSMKQMMMLSLLENPSASERIRAVGYTDEMGAASRKVIDALLTTLNQDANVNVRLITLDALARLSGNPIVREGLVQSIARQDSPLVQSAIADLMVKLQEKRSVKPLQKLLHKKDLNGMVKTKIEQSIQKLI
jgi:hypothetical protein